MRQAPQPVPDTEDAPKTPKTELLVHGDSNHSSESVEKRALDLSITLPMLLIAAPLILIAGIAIRLTSRGPALFIQTRIGQNRKPFACYKLRTMRIGTPQQATHLASPHHITAIGRILRRSKMDELPQLWNVLRGDMSLIGPRPCLPDQSELIQEREQRGVYAAKPGITGLAQVSGCDMSNPGRCAQLDADYINHRTLRLDLKILLKTVFF